MIQDSSLCQYLEWDSNFFGYKIAQLTVHRLISEDMASAMMWCHTYHINCLYFLADPDDAETIHLAEANGFHLVDIRLTFERQLHDLPLLKNASFPDNIRLSTSDDLPFLRAIAKVSYVDSRFYFDPHFPSSRCDTLYETWIEKSCHGYADAVIVAESQSQPVGYVSCHLLPQRIGKIGLVGVSANAQEKGFGKKMINASLLWFAEHNVTQVLIVTQGRNLKAQRLYQKCGFLTHSIQLFYHKWFLST